MLLPSSLRIGGRPWAIQETTKRSLGSHGRCDYASHTISVNTGQDEFDVRDTVLHETLHALLEGAPFKRSPEQEERYVLFLATRLTGLLQENPEFAQWLIAPIKTP